MPISILFSLIGGLRGIGMSFAVMCITLSLARLYDRLIDDPALIANVKRDVVARVEIEAAKARIRELERQINVGAQVLDEYRRRQAADAINDVALQARYEQEIAAYENELVISNRHCKLTNADLMFLRKH